MRFERHIVAATAATLMLALAACGGGKGGGSLSTISPDEPSLGKADAPVTLIEYASTACGHCADFNNKTFHALKEKHIDTGEVRYAMREIITPPESFAIASFAVARCLPREKYYPFIDAVFRSQMAIFQSGDLAGGLKQIALSAGMSEAEYQACVMSEENIKAVEERALANGKESQITGTPTFFINGEKTKLAADSPLEDFSKAIAEAKAK